MAILMSLWADYHKERLGWDEIREEGQGFVAYFINPPVCQIKDAYVAPEFRKSDVALRLRSRLTAAAKESGCTEIQTEIWPGLGDAESAMRFNIANGFKIFAAEGGRIIMVKFIGEVSCG